MKNNIIILTGSQTNVRFAMQELIARMTNSDSYKSDLRRVNYAR